MRSFLLAAAVLSLLVSACEVRIEPPRFYDDVCASC